MSEKKSLLACPINILFIGPPGAGKSSQARIISDCFKLHNVNIGNTLREKAKSNQDINNSMTQGKLIDDEFCLKLLEEQIDNIEPFNGLLFDGNPKNLKQAERLDEIFHKRNMKLTVVIEFKIDEDEIFKRTSKRWIHLPSGRTYHDEFNPPKTPMIDDITGEKLDRRIDDNKEALKNRLELNRIEMNQLENFYKQKGVYESIDASLDKNIVTTKIKSIIQRLSYKILFPELKKNILDNYNIEEAELFYQFIRDFINIIHSGDSSDETLVKLKGLIDTIINHFGNNKKCLLFSVMGNIGIGKTTFASQLNIPEVQILKEPLCVWECIKNEMFDKDLLQTFYFSFDNFDNRDEYLFDVPFFFQIMATFTIWLVYIFAKGNKKDGVLASIRSIYSNKPFYILNNHLYSDEQKKIYIKFKEFLFETFNEENVCFIYLTCKQDEAKTCSNRIMKRNRLAESNLEVKYLAELTKLTELTYNEWKGNKICIITSGYPSKFNEIVKAILNEKIKNFKENNYFSFQLTINDDE